MKLKNVKKLLIKNLILCGSLLPILSIESSAIGGDLDLTHKSIVRNFGGSGNDYSYSVVETSDKGMVVVGCSDSSNAGFTNRGNDEAVIIKYDKYGRKEWIKSFGGSDYDCFTSVIETSDKGIVVVGYSDSTNAGFVNKGNQDAIMIKYDKDGNQEWIKSFGGSGVDYFESVIETSDKGIVAVGWSGSTNVGFTNKGTNDAIIVKYDNEGNQLWIKNFGGSGADSFSSVIETSDGKIVAVGDSNSANAGFSNKGNTDTIVVKYDSQGNQEWVKNFGGSSYEYIFSVVETNDKGIVFVGNSRSTNAGFINKGNYDAIIIKCDKDGNQEWIKSFGGSDYDSFSSVIETDDNAVIVVGDSKSSDTSFKNKGDADAIMIKYNEDGNQEWIKVFGGSSVDRFESIVKASNNGVIAVGYSFSRNAGFTNKGSFDSIIAKYNQDCGDNESVFDKVYNLEDVNSSIDNSQKLEEARGLVNNIENEEIRRYLNEKLDSFNIGFGELERKTSSANLDVYIKCENILLMSIDTNSVTFEDFSGVEDMIKENAVNITINSSLPYQLNAYLPVEIQNSDKTNTMNKDILNIKENSESDYKEFLNINEKVVLKDNCPAGNDLIHGVDLKLVGGIAHEKDVYKTTIKFEAEQK